MPAARSMRPSQSLVAGEFHHHTMRVLGFNRDTILAWIFGAGLPLPPTPFFSSPSAQPTGGIFAEGRFSRLSRRSWQSTRTFAGEGGRRTFIAWLFPVCSRWCLEAGSPAFSASPLRPGYLGRLGFADSRKSSPHFTDLLRVTFHIADLSSLAGDFQHLELLRYLRADS